MSAQPGVLLVYRRSDLDAGAVARFVDALLAQLSAEGLHIDLVYEALRRSEVTADGPRHCTGLHEDTSTGLRNDLADVLYHRIAGDRLVRGALRTIVREVLVRTTSPPPARHLTLGEAVALRDCCAPRGTATHIDDYDIYAALHAHASVCGDCTARVWGHE